MEPFCFPLIKMTCLQLLEADTAVSGYDQPAEAQRPGRGQLRGQTETGGGQQLEAGGGEAELREDGVQIEDRREEHSGGQALTLTHLQHPVSHNLAVVGGDELLDLGHVVPDHGSLVMTLRHQEVVEDSDVTEQHRVWL